MILNALGDSITAGTYVTGSNIYAAQAATRFELGFNNYGVSGDMAMDQSYKIETINPGDINSIFLSTNDTDTYRDNAAKRAVFIQYLRALAVFMGGSSIASGRSCAKTGTWANVTAAGNTLGSYTDALNATATKVIHGTAAYISVIAFNAGGDSNFEVWIDGTKVDTVTVSGSVAGSSANGRAYSNLCLRYGGLSNASHTVMVKQISSSIRLHLTYVGGSEMVTRKPIIVGNAIRKAQYLSNDNDANIQAYCNDIATMVSELQSDGFNIQLADYHAVVDPTTDLQDRIHPNLSGHNKMATALINAILATLTVSVGSGPCTPVPCAPVTGHKIYTGKTLDINYDSTGTPTSVTIT